MKFLGSVYEEEISATVEPFENSYEEGREGFWVTVLGTDPSHYVTIAKDEDSLTSGYGFKTIYSGEDALIMFDNETLFIKPSTVNVKVSCWQVRT